MESKAKKEAFDAALLMLQRRSHPSGGRGFSEMDITVAFNVPGPGEGVPNYALMRDGWVIRYDPLSNTIKNLGYLKP